MKRILFIEDDKNYASIITQVLRDSNYIVDHVDNSIDGLNYAKENEYDIALIDLYIDQLLGTQVLEIMKLNNTNLKTILISNSDNAKDELKSLQSGAVDFIKKDTSIEIFLERIKKTLDYKNTNPIVQMVKSDIENIEVDLIKRLAYKNNEVVHLTKIEFDMLAYFLMHKNESLSRPVLVKEVWKLPHEIDMLELRTVDTHVKNLKSKLQLSSIVSVRGIGYRWYENQ